MRLEGRVAIVTGGRLRGSRGGEAKRLIIQWHAHIKGEAVLDAKPSTSEGLRGAQVPLAGLRLLVSPPPPPEET